MPATLIKEDGSGLSDANTYISLADYEAYLDERGLSDATTDDAKTGRIIQSMDYLETKDTRFQGYKKNSGQSLVWPRTSVIVNPPYYLDSSTIPSQLKNAQAQLVYDSASTGIYNVGDGRSIVKDKVGPIETTFSDLKGADVQPIFAKVEAMLKPLYKRTGGFGSVIRG